MAGQIDVDWLGRLGATSELGRLVAEHDWAASPIGAVADWPESLRISVTLCLSTRFPMLVVWGPDLIKIYNDGYRQILGRDKHPRALGAPARDVWPEIWDHIGPLLERVMTTGESYWSEHERLVIERFGFPEECHFIFSFSPIHTDDGSIGGVLDVVTETTEQVVNQRRLGCLSQLGASLVGATEVADVCIRAVGALSHWTDEVPSAELRLRVGDHLVPVATVDRHLLTDEDDVDDALDPSGQPTVLDGGWEPGRPANRVAVGVGGTAANGVLVVRPNPLRPFDTAARDFVALVGRTIGSALEDTARRTEELGEQRLINHTLQEAMLALSSNLPTVAARYVPAASELSVGGDWYDVIDLGGGRRGLVVGDCVGHGLDAATVMGQLRNASRALLVDGREPAQVLESMDAFARSVDGAACATMMCAIVDREARTMTYASAGHLPPLLVRDGAGRWLEGGGVPLAVGQPERTEVHTTVELDDLLVLYTDGLVERRGQSIDDGLERLRQATEACAERPVHAIPDLLLGALVEGRPDDDVALVVKRVT